MASKFEGMFSRGMAAGIPQGVAMFERFQERAATDKERKALAAERAAATAASAEEREYKRGRDVMEDIYKFGGQDPALIRQGLAQEAEPSKFPRLEDSELYQFQRKQAAPDTSMAPTSVFSTPAEQSLTKFREMMARKNEPYSERIEAQKSLIQARTEAERGLIGERAAAQVQVKQAPKYKGMGGGKAPESAEGATKSWLDRARGKAGGGSYKSANDVRAAVSAGKIKREEGIKILREQFGMK